MKSEGELSSTANVGYCPEFVALVLCSGLVCSAYDRTLTLLLYLRFDWLYRNNVSIYLEVRKYGIPSNYCKTRGWYH